MLTAFVLSGGGSLGAVQVGMLEALQAVDVHPDMLVGTSAGALNAAYIASHGFDKKSLDGLAAIWCGLRRRDVFPLSPIRAVAAVTHSAPSLCSNSALRELISRNIVSDRLEATELPVHLVTTDVCSGEEVLLSAGDTTDAVLASAAIPGVFPSVEIDGRYLVDGGIANNAAVSQAVTLGAERVFVLPSGYTCALDTPPATALGSVLQALNLLIEQRLIHEVASYSAQVDLRVLPPLCPLAVSSTDFGHAGELINRARSETLRWLATCGGSRVNPERFLSLHAHRSSASGCGLGSGGRAA